MSCLLGMVLGMAFRGSGKGLRNHPQPFDFIKWRSQRGSNPRFRRERVPTFIPLQSSLFPTSPESLLKFYNYSM